MSVSGPAPETDAEASVSETPQALSRGDDRAEVVTLCGSSRFKDAFLAESARLTREGRVVISLGLFGHTDLPDADWTTDGTDLKRMLDRLHFQKIDLADRIHVVDVGGYYGESTSREVAYARSLGKPVTFLSGAETPDAAVAGAAHPRPEPETPALAREAWDRAAEERGTPGLLGALRADPSTLVLAVHGDRAPVEGGALRLVAPEGVAEHVEWAFLGRDPGGRGVLLAAAPADGAAPIAWPVDPAAEDSGWVGLRAAGADLPDADVGLFVEGLSLGRWLLDAPHCPFCGHRCEVRQAGWSRHCPHCGREHFPRTDPAVIVAVTDAAGERLLLGAARAWGGDRFSCFAGFVEAGESLEATVRRELFEEAGVHVERLSYHASQAWPYPRSLMVGFHAVASGVGRPDGDEIVEVRWFTRDEIVEALAGRGPVGLPGRASIAHALITAWVERTA